MVVGAIMLRLCVLLFALLAGRAGAESLSPQAFTAAFAAATKEAIPSVNVKVTGDLQLEIRYADGKTATADLDNVYRTYLRDPGHLQDAVRNFVASVLPPQEKSGEALDPRAFTEVAARAVTAALPRSEVKVAGDLKITFRQANGETATSDLTNAYKLYNRDPQVLDRILQRYVTAVSQLAGAGPAALMLDRSRIVPVLKSRPWFDHSQQLLLADKPPKELLNEPFAGDLVLVYADDGAATMRFLTTLDEVGDRAALRRVAVANLKHRLPKIEMRAGADHVFLISAGGDYEASLLLVDEIWSGGQIKVDGDIVVAAPAKDALIVTGSNNPAGLARLRTVAADLVSGAYGLSETLFVWRGGKFAVFDGN